MMRCKEVAIMYRGKVIIAGVDTARLPVMKEEEKERLLLQVKSGTASEQRKAREALVKGNLGLVLSVVQRFSGRGENLDDLFQVGCIGLIKAIDHFDLNQSVRFSTYAVPMIIGEVRRFLRDYAPVRVSRSLKDLAYRAMQEKERLTRALGRDPTIIELSSSLGIPKSEVVLALESASAPVSIYEPVYSGDSGEPLCVMDQLSGGNSDADWIDEITIRDAIESLSRREKKILGLRFFEGRTQTEVSGVIGISQAQVSRLEKGALHKIQQSLKV